MIDPPLSTSMPARRWTGTTLRVVSIIHSWVNFKWLLQKLAKRRHQVAKVLGAFHFHSPFTLAHFFIGLQGWIVRGGGSWRSDVRLGEIRLSIINNLISLNWHELAANANAVSSDEIGIAPYRWRCLRVWIFIGLLRIKFSWIYLENKYFPKL